MSEDDEPQTFIAGNYGSLSMVDAIPGPRLPPRAKSSPGAPRSRLCWECGRKLRGRHHVEREIEGHSRVLHLHCSDRLVEEEFRR